MSGEAGRKPEIEPLGEARWARIEQGLMRRLAEAPPTGGESRAEGASSRATRWLRAGARFGGVAAAGAAVALVVRAAWPGGTTTSRFATEGSASHVAIKEATLDVAPESNVEVRDDARATVVVLERGAVTLHVAPHAADRPLWVEAGNVKVRIVGTDLSVRRAGAGAVVTVTHGVVEVTSPGEAARVEAGETWPAPTSAATGAAEATGATGATAARDVAPPADAPAAPDPRAEATASDESLVPAEAPRASRRRSGAGGPSAQARYEAAARIERASPDRALRAYASLARGSDRWAANALFAAGRLEADRGDVASARQLLESYLRRFPKGPNAEDARALLVSLR